MAPPAVLMSDPRHFDIRGAANPHTRDDRGRKKTVDRNRALDQWHGYVDRLLDAGVDVYVVPPEPDLTGMVFAANAGYLIDRPKRAVPLHRKRFLPSHFTADHRRGESTQFEQFMGQMGCSIESYPEDLRFEGEADAFPVADEWIFTYGFRSDPEMRDWLARKTGITLDAFELSDPAYYHGDCLLCDLGDAALGWCGGLTDRDAERLRALFGNQLLELSDEEAATFVGNSFYVEPERQRLLFTVHDIPDPLTKRIEDRGIDIIRVDVSEMFGKGGGGPKCMVFNLGRVARRHDDAPQAVNEFRHAHRVEQMRKSGRIPAAPGSSQ